jgi:hypothetical protein
MGLDDRTANCQTHTSSVRLGRKECVKETLIHKMKTLQIERPERSEVRLKLPLSDLNHPQDFDQAANGFGD